jgi:RNase P subunit RPR2
MSGPMGISGIVRRCKHCKTALEVRLVAPALPGDAVIAKQAVVVTCPHCDKGEPPKYP